MASHCAPLQTMHHVLILSLCAHILPVLSPFTRNEEYLSGSPVVAFKACKVSDFGGRSLSSSFASQVFLNPDRREAHELRSWFDTAAPQLAELQNLSKQGRGDGSAAGGGAASQRKVLSDIKDEG